MASDITEKVAATALLVDWIIKRFESERHKSPQQKTRHIAHAMVNVISNCAPNEQNLFNMLCSVAMVWSNDGDWTPVHATRLAEDVLRCMKLLFFDPAYLGPPVPIQTVGAMTLAVDPMSEPGTLNFQQVNGRLVDDNKGPLQVLKPQTIKFTDLAAELRNRIYEAIFAPSDRGLLVTVGRSYTDTKRRPDAMTPAIAQTSKQIRHETLPMFYNNMTFSIVLSSPENLEQAKKRLNSIPKSYRRYLNKIQVHMMKPRYCLGPISIRWKDEIDKDNEATVENVISLSMGFMQDETSMTPFDRDFGSPCPVEHFNATLDRAMEEYYWDGDV